MFISPLPKKARMNENEKTTGKTTLVASGKGENAWQSPSQLYDFGADDPLALKNFALVEGAPLSYNNWADIDGGLQGLTHVAAALKKGFGAVPHIAIGLKHGSACGSGVSRSSQEEALRKMIDGDPEAIFGGVVITNFAITAERAEILNTHAVGAGAPRRILDCVAASVFDNEAVKMLSRKGGKCRLLENSAIAKDGAALLDTAERFRYVRGGALSQKNYTFVPEADKDVWVSCPFLDGWDAWTDLFLAWGIGSTSKSNTVTLVKDGKLLANAVGQQSRVGAAELAVFRAKRAGHETKGALAYSDSFFPFVDGADVLIKAGVVTIFATSGSIRDKEVTEHIQNAGVRLVLIPDEKGRGFFGH
ncbi:MAG: hypothetical protein HYY60_01945 [Parcubacteria group bacterium]|nr:hypothetical protein [Parcubacteria group bacterium]MBI3074989.1 hypothetical protein [Parcubacteria group bacterium]